MRGPIHRPDPDSDRRDRARAQHGMRQEHLAVAAVCAQFLLSLPAGVWAASVANDDSGHALLAGAVAMFLATGAALVIANGFRFMAGSALAVVELPRLIRNLTSKAARFEPHSPGEVRREWLLRVATTALHALVLLAGALLIAAVIAGFTAASFADLAWRFGLAAAGLSIFTWRGLTVAWSP